MIHDMAVEAWGERIRGAFCAACRPPAHASTSVGAMTMAGLFAPLLMSKIVPLRAPLGEPVESTGAVTDVNALVVALFEQEGRSLVRLADSRIHVWSSAGWLCPWMGG